MFDSRRFYTLDLLRFLAATAILILHTEMGAAIFNHAYVGVDFFFVLSGFIVSYSYYDRLSLSGFLSYVIRRLARLWPLNVYALVVYALIPTGIFFVIPHEDFPVRNFFLNFFLLQNMGLGAEGSYVANSWSISAEFWVNVLFPLFCWPLLKIFKDKEHQAMVLGLCATAALFFLILCYGHLEIVGNPLMHLGHFGTGLLRCFSGFTFGVLTYFLFKKMNEDLFVLDGPLWSFLEFLSIVLCVSFFVFCARRAATDLFAVPLSMLVVFVFAVQKGQLSRLLSRFSRVLSLLGCLSYGIYLWSIPIGTFLNLKFDIFSEILLYYVLTIAVAVFSYFVLELPSKKLLLKLQQHCDHVLGWGNMAKG